MRGFLVALAALVCFAAPPAAAQSYYFPAAGGSGPVGNVSTTLERFPETGVTAHGTLANTIGGPSSVAGTTVNAWSGFSVTFFAFNPTARFICDISLDGGTTWPIYDLFLLPNSASTGVGVEYPIPYAVPAGSAIRGRCQSSNAGQSVSMMIVGEVASSSRPPGYSNFVAITPVDRANTKAGTTDVTMSAASWTSLADPTSPAFGALIAVADVGTTAPSTALWAKVILAAGPSGGGSEAEIASFGIGLASTSAIPRKQVSRVLPVAVPTGNRISVKAQPISGTTDTTTQIRVAVYGLY